MSWWLCTLITTDCTLNVSRSAYIVNETNGLLGIELVLDPPPPVGQCIEINVKVVSDNASGELLLNYSIVNCHWLCKTLYVSIFWMVYTNECETLIIKSMLNCFTPRFSSITYVAINEQAL